MPIDTLENGLGRAELVEEHDKDALKGHRIEIGAVLLMLDTNANDNAQDFVEKVDFCR